MLIIYSFLLILLHSIPVVLGFWSRGRPERTWKEVVEVDMKSLKLSKEDALVCGKWR